MTKFEDACAGDSSNEVRSSGFSLPLWSSGFAGTVGNIRQFDNSSVSTAVFSQDPVTSLMEICKTCKIWASSLLTSSGAGAYSVRVFWPVLGAGVAPPSRTDEKL